MLDGLSALPSNVWTMSVSLRGVPTSVMAPAAAAGAAVGFAAGAGAAVAAGAWALVAAGFAAAAVGAAAPVVGSGGVGDGVQAATNAATINRLRTSLAEPAI